MRYERQLQAQLRGRYNQLCKTNYVTYKWELSYFRQFILGVPALAAIVDTTQRSEPDLDPDTRYTDKFNVRNCAFPENEMGWAKFIWRIIERIASGELDIMEGSRAFRYRFFRTVKL